MERSPQFAVAERIAADFAVLLAVRAVAVAGSLTGPFRDPTSDIDLYVYADEPPPLEQRLALIGDGRGVELNNEFWETGDEWEETEHGIAIDVIYRAPAWVEAELDRLLVRHEASTGYTTAVWHNVRTSVALADPTGWLAAAKTRADQPYPEGLRRAIIAKNHPLLRRAKGAYRNQIAKALDRGDVVSIQHRVTVLLESVFDILFAVNLRPHPGEKQLLTWVGAVCDKRPNGFDDHIRAILRGTAGAPDLLRSVDALVNGLDHLLRQEGLLHGDELTL